MTDPKKFTIKNKIAALAFQRRFQNCGFGGYGCNVGALIDYCQAGYAPILECLKELHGEGRVYLHHWREGRFQPWECGVPNTFFNDFYLLAAKPV